MQQGAVEGNQAGGKHAHIIVLGNEKGGSGKTTTGMHLIVSLLRLGFQVGSIDLDSRQRSLSRYIENRRQTSQREGVSLPQPHHIVLQRSPFNIADEAEQDEHDRFNMALARLMSANDFVVIDSPGNDTFLSRLAHSYANTIITPINDSFVDLDVLATVDGQSLQVIKPSIYSEMIWEQKLKRAKRDGGSIEWIVMRNRLSNLTAKNKLMVTQVIGELSRRIGFRVAPGFSERVIFRELFLQGLTVLDIMQEGTNINVSLSHVAARQEVRDLLKTLRIPQVDMRLSEFRTAITDEEKSVADQAESRTAAAAVAKEAAKEQEAVKELPDLTGASSSVGSVPASAAPAEASVSGTAQEDQKIPA